MKFVFSLLVGLVLLIANVSWAGMMETVPAGEEVYRWVYEHIDELYARGLISDPNSSSAKEVLTEHGMTVEQLLEEFRLYNGYYDVAKTAEGTP